MLPEEDEQLARRVPLHTSESMLMRAGWLGMLAVLVVLTVADLTLVIVLFDKYTETFAQFINQGTAFVYCIASTVIVIVRWWRTRRTQSQLKDKSAAPWYKWRRPLILRCSSNRKRKKTN